ncbi:class I SAM-dependent methyltransferase [Olleya sp. Bg11-27]|uniref:class I SAM-dependent methyltransferase n=1 Tax=Olleya sp. Bg11-27 TaxID=2058135 RepID=UPI000C314FA5|nr:class I SAM-dependent methyltransferase [Olleya sp. Bg11-27]AUC77303.1 SAM-dependent methyltransferase [Olleya sp. Bg11-27]
MEHKEIKKNKKPWPTKDAMAQVYTNRLWGCNQSDFYSGEGSHDPEIVKPYIEVLIAFLTSFKKPLVVCDLGCGDFNIGKQLVQHAKKYEAVDIVAALITYNEKEFVADNLQFYCLDIAVADLPAGDCIILRQVLQHLSNAEVASVVQKLAHYKYVVITEHVPNGDFIPNMDIVSGQGIRLKKQSGVNVLAPPFNFKVIKNRPLLSYTLDNNKGRIVTTLYQVF